ncbi:MAG: laccase domain-containing protein [Merdibacter sp.]
MTLRDCTAPLCGSMALHTGEEAGAVMENRRRLSEETLPLSRWCCAMQTHSANAYAVTAEDAGRGALTIDDAIPACDALYTRERGVLIGVFTADCVPLLCTILTAASSPPSTPDGPGRSSGSRIIPSRG